jgi:hypothetical protein
LAIQLPTDCALRSGELGSFLEVVAQSPVRHQHRSDREWQLVFGEEPALLVVRQFWKTHAQLSLPYIVDTHRHQVGVGEIAVVVSHFLGAERLRCAGLAVVVAGFLADGAAAEDDCHLALYLVGNAVAHEGDGI